MFRHTKNNQTDGRFFGHCEKITKLIKDSPYSDDIFTKLKAATSLGAPGIRALCLTRWTVRADSLQSILANFETLQSVWDEALEYVKDSDMKARVRGVSTHLRNFDIFFVTMLGHLILSHSDNLSCTFRGIDISASEGQSVA